MRQARSGRRERTSRQTSTPLPSGSRTSSTATAGRAAGMRATASAAVAASPTTSMSSSSPRSAVMPRRTTSWSSSRNTRMVPWVSDTSRIPPAGRGAGPAPAGPAGPAEPPRPREHTPGTGVRHRAPPEPSRSGPRRSAQRGERVGGGGGPLVQVGGAGLQLHAVLGAPAALHHVEPAVVQRLQAVLAAGLPAADPGLVVVQAVLAQREQPPALLLRLPAQLALDRALRAVDHEQRVVREVRLLAPVGGHEPVAGVPVVLQVLHAVGGVAGVGEVLAARPVRAAGVRVVLVQRALVPLP